MCVFLFFLFFPPVFPLLIIEQAVEVQEFRALGSDETEVPDRDGFRV